jgi:hypothetical protein
MLIKLGFSRHNWKQSSNIKFHKNPFSRSRVIPCKPTDMTKLIVTLCNFAKSPKTWSNVIITKNIKFREDLLGFWADFTNIFLIKREERYDAKWISLGLVSTSGENCVCLLNFVYEEWERTSSKSKSRAFEWNDDIVSKRHFSFQNCVVLNRKMFPT